MNQEGFKRKLTSIFSADAVEYSRLMGDDEEATVRTLKSYRDVMFSLIKQNSGTVIDSTGDNLLAEFVSVVDAVQCAVAVQKEIKARNDELPVNRRMQFRIGINLGDVIQEDDRVYGDGVNIAARLEGLAEPGGICISKTAFDHIESKLPYGYEFLGDQTVKNIAKPVGAYRVLMEPRVTVAGEPEEEKPAPIRRIPILVGAAVVLVLAIAIGVWQFYVRRPSVEPASKEKMAYPLPDKPSIVVLPFDNLSGNPEQDYIADGISDNIISALSYIPEMFVIARNSSFTYKGKPVKIQQVSEELGVQYVLEGSVLKSGDKIRITAQLIDALTGGHIWSERYDRDFKDLFDLMDEITQEVVVALQVKLTSGEQARMWYGSTRNLEAWGYAVKGLGPFYHYTKDGNAKARELFKRAVEIDPEYVHAIVMLGMTHFIDARIGYTDSRAESLKLAEEMAKKAMALNDNDPTVHSLWEYIYMIRGEYDKAVEEGRKSIALAPNNADIHSLFGQLLYFSGMFEESVEMCEKAVRLHPNPPLYFLVHLALAYRWVGRYDESLAVTEQLIERSRKVKYLGGVIGGYAISAVTYIKLGRDSDARKNIAEILKIHPKYSLRDPGKTELYKDPAHLQEVLDALRKAGAPEHPPLKLPDKPSIAVLPFDNLSKDPEQEYFADGMTDDLITDLSKISGLFVIARNSTFQYKEKAVDIKKVPI
jgi:adenylate cyclase